jgi:hypothetical protein
MLMQNIFNRMRAIAAISLFLVTFLVMAGCAATQVQQVWTDEASPGGRLNSVFIIVLVNEPSTRRMFETEFARYFKYRGNKAAESFRDLEIETFYEKGSRDAVLAKLREQGIDAVLMTRVVDHRTKENIIPGMTITAGYGMWGASAGVGYTFGGPSAPTTQSYSREENFLGLETSVFDVRTEKLLWSIRTETRITGTPQDEIKPYVGLVTEKLFRAKWFQ